MEFYKFPLIKMPSVSSSFQFPTGWNSTKYPLKATLENIKFQFPTGWNSTYLRSDQRLPNGSFNSQRDGILPITHFYIHLYQCSFNSQRDGILLRYPRGYGQAEKVSIPNGMEFYLKPITFIIAAGSFNSQRDGILPISPSM